MVAKLEKIEWRRGAVELAWQGSALRCREQSPGVLIDDLKFIRRVFNTCIYC